MSGGKADGPPRNLRSLMDRLRNQARGEGALEARVQRRLAALVVAEMLARVDLGTEGPPLLVKGGSALELRLGLAGSRTSKDLDAVVRGSLESFIRQAETVVRQPLAGFTGKLKDIREVPVPGMSVTPRQFKVALTYQGKPFATVPVEVSPPEGNAAADFDEVSAPAVAHLGLEDFPPVPCLSVRYQVAQKLHACTDPLSDGRVNVRARDLVDILLLAKLLTDDEMPHVHAACVDVFSTRGRHSWPPELAAPPVWEELYPTAADGLEALVPSALEDAVQDVKALLARICAVDPVPVAT